MKVTTDSQLADQAYKDFLEKANPTDKKKDVCFMYNQYAAHYGLPVKLETDSSDKYAKLAARVLMYLARDLKAVRHQSEYKTARSKAQSCNWLAEQVKETWGLEGISL